MLKGSLMHICTSFAGHCMTTLKGILTHIRTLLAGHCSNSPGRHLWSPEGAGQGRPQLDPAAHCGAGSRQCRDGGIHNDSSGHGQACKPTTTLYGCIVFTLTTSAGMGVSTMIAHGMVKHVSSQLPRMLVHHSVQHLDIALWYWSGAVQIPYRKVVFRK